MAVWFKIFSRSTADIGFSHPLFDTDLVTVKSGLTFNCGEFAIIKRRVVHLLPDSEKLNGILVPTEKVAKQVLSAPMRKIHSPRFFKIWSPGRTAGGSFSALSP